MKSKLSVLIVSLFFIYACSEDDVVNGPVDNYDREAMLVNWADNIIVPRYEAYLTTVNRLADSKDNFINDSNLENLEQLRMDWKYAYIAWQRVSMFEIGKAEQLTLRDFINTYPTNAGGIEEHMAVGSYNLELPSTRAQQGFPAIDYLLYGTADSDEAIIARFTDEPGMRTYLDDVIDRIQNLSDQVLNDWKSGYRDAFVANSGSGATASVNKMLNDFMFYYERCLRAGKIGIPAGVFSNTPLSDRVEAYYNREISHTLYMESLYATMDFFNGVHFNSNGLGESLNSYLDFVNTVSNGEPLSHIINIQFDETIQVSEQLKDNLANEVETNNRAMLAVYDALQKNTVLMKVDMFQALNVKIGYVDADGD